MKRQEHRGRVRSALGRWRNVRSHLPTVSSPAGPSRAQPNLTGAGRAGPTAPHRTGPLFAVAPASYDTHFEREGKCGLKVCVCCHGPGAEEERLSALYWSLMYAVDAYGLQICKQDQYDTQKGSVDGRMERQGG
ncbi:uncharacterized protein LOC144461808 [Epinephelus lanceolatus]